MNNKTLNLEKYLSRFPGINVSKLVPLIRWDPNWKIPKELKIGSYTVNKKFNGQIKNIQRHRLLGKLESNQSKLNTKKWYKGDKLRGGLKYIHKEKYVWLILKSNLTTKININKINLIFEDGWLKLKVSDNFVGIWFKYGNGRINFTITPKIIELNEMFWETFGILYGEMLRKGNQIAIANTEPNMINCILNFFDKNNIIPKEAWNVTLAINGKDIPYEKRKETLKSANEYWRNKLIIPNLFIKNVYWYNCKSTLKPNYGEIDIRFYNLSLKKVIIHLFEFVEENVLKNKNYSLSFLRGLMAAEGGVDYVNKNIRTVRIASNNKKERELYHKLFQIVGIKAKLYDGRHNIVINSIPNFIKCKKLDILRLHKRKNNNFLESFNNSLSIKLFLLFKNDILTKEEIIDKLFIKNIKQLDYYLNSLMQLGYIKKRGNKYFLNENFGKTNLCRLQQDRL